ncbi:MAG: phosphate regulon sensor histidine kinase PhoR [Burkholderiales bacterium]|nr:phosphate regulon sensor histidine kinase PhoR [Burkholderiales bacterium]
MFEHWRKPLGTVALCLIPVLVVWPIAGLAWAFGIGFAVLALVLIHHLRNLSQFHRWLLAPRQDNLPVGSGLWEHLFSYLSRMLRQQALVEGQLHDRLSRFQSAGAALPEAVVILDADNRIDWCNPKAEAFFSLHAIRDRGQQINYLVRQPQFVDYLQRSDFSAPFNLRLSGIGGDTILSVQIVPYGDNEKLLLGRDITRWERLETTRRDFVANVSHELRTPLTVLNGFLETLSDMEEPDPEMTQRSLYLMSQQCTRMNRLVEDLLTLSRLESTVSPLREESVHVAELIQHLYQDALALSGNRHEIHLKLESRADLMGNLDEIRSAFGNLVSNAIRYTPDKGRIELRWFVRNGEPVFAVTDTGIGIAPQHIDRLTERFYRVDRSRSRETGGTGLGLAIVKHVLSRHQAHLEIHSEPGQGSTFSAVFPAERLQRAAQPSRRDIDVERAAS